MPPATIATLLLMLALTLVSWSPGNAFAADNPHAATTRDLAASATANADAEDLNGSECVRTHRTVPDTSHGRGFVLTVPDKSRDHGFVRTVLDTSHDRGFWRTVPGTSPHRSSLSPTPSGAPSLQTIAA